MEVPPLPCFKRVCTYFQGHYIFTNIYESKRLLGWAHLALINLVPFGYRQYDILMVQGRASGVLLLVYYVLT
ncbi:Hypothetical protein PHPALM_9165 [Phytophthora palmivora]|uniref:Uncharacterized protein n=1 Tax=Phytophthora palmivora TaxID=4796 RepID=A0A2P4Y804_9STRA|nr:Hypothetical protein PHPALM_9165 [Phytophthora palmivora]